MDNQDLFDPFREIWVKATPEEVVRQKLLKVMVDKGGFPKELIAVEKGLHTVPHLLGVKALPERRADIICFAKDIHPQYSLYPLLLIECKDQPITQKAFDQIQGYNAFLQAHFLALADMRDVFFGFYHGEHKRYVFQKGLPSYADLLSSLKNSN